MKNKPTDISKYHINIKRLKNARDMLLKKDLTPELIKEIEFLTAYIKDTDLVKHVTFKDNKSFERAYKSDFTLMFDNYFNYLQYIFEFYDLSDSDFTNEPYTKIVDSYEEVFTSIHDFYKSLDTEWFKLFNNLYKHRFQSIQISNDRSYSLLFPQSNIWIANLKSNLTIEDYLYAAHEYAHGIADQISPTLKSYSPENIFIEVFPILCHLLFLRTCNNHLVTEANKAIGNYKNLMINYAEETKFKFNIASLFGSQITNSRNASRLIKKTFKESLSRQEINEIYSNPVDNNICYVFPYIIASELISLFYTDEDLFKYKVNTILKSEKNPIDLLEKLNIEPNKILKK